METLGQIHRTIVLLTATAFVLWGCGQGMENGETTTVEHSTEAVRISGSASALPLVKLLANEFERLHPESRILFLPATHTHGGLAGVREGDLNIGILSRAMTDKERTGELQYLHLAQDGIVFATHKSVTIKNVTTQQIRDIFSGKILNWQELGGENQPIHVLDRPDYTSAKIILQDQLFGEDLEVVEDAMVLERPSQMNESLKVVPYSIGYTSLGDVISNDLEVNILYVDGIPPTPTHVQKGLYRLSRPFGLVIHGAPQKSVMRFIDFIYSDTGVSLIHANGYVPLVSEFVIATIPERNILKQEERYDPLVNYLTRELGGNVKIGLRHLSSYPQIVDEFVEGRVNAAFFGSFVYVLTRSKMRVEAVARPVRDGLSEYRGLIFTRKDSGITDWRDLKGRSFAMIRATTAGDVFPRMYFKNHGVEDLDEHLGRIHYVGSHDAAILKVFYGEIDAGAAKDLVYEKLARDDPSIARQLKILARSASVPENALVIRSNLDFVCFNCHPGKDRGELGGPVTAKSYPFDLKTRLREILLNLDQTPEGRAVLRKFGADRFVATDHADYGQLYRMIEAAGIDLHTHFGGRGE